MSNLSNLPVQICADAEICTDLAQVQMDVQVQQPADRNPALVYVARLSSAQSRRTMRGHLERMAALLSPGATAEGYPWHELRYAHTAALRSLLAERHAPATANLALSALRGVLREAWRLGLMSAEESRRACDLAPIKAETLPSGRALSGKELKRLLKACRDGTPIGIRDAAVCALLYGCGLRRQELAGLDLADYHAEEGSLKVRGKGRKERQVFVGADAERVLSAWLELRGSEPGPLFLPLSRGGNVQARRLTGQAVYNLYARRAGMAGLAHTTPHDMRRSMCSDLIDAGVDISTVQKMMGHSNVTTTIRYDRRSDGAKKKAANLLKM